MRLRAKDQRCRLLSKPFNLSELTEWFCHVEHITRSAHDIFDRQEKKTT